MEEKMYSDTPGKGIKDNFGDYLAVEAFFTYMEKERKHGRGDAFILPDFFINARKKFTREEVHEIFEKVQEEMK